MALAETIERQGNWLFRHRSYFPLLIIVPGFVWFGFRTYVSGTLNPWWLDVVFLVIGFIGLGIRVITVGYTPVGTSGRNTTAGQIAETLNTTGIYSTVRHPLYLGNFFMWLAPVLVIGDLWFTMFFVAFYWIYYERIMYAEEAFLRRKFGDIYTAWAATTPAFIPRLRNYKATPLTFSGRNVLKREYNGFFNLILIMTIFRLTANALIFNELYLDIVWTCIFGIGLLIFVTLKILKKFTSVLDVKGR